MMAQRRNKEILFAIKMTQLATRRHDAELDSSQPFMVASFESHRGRHLLSSPPLPSIWQEYSCLTQAERLALLSLDDLERLALHSGAVLALDHVRLAIDRSSVAEIDAEWGRPLRLFVLKTAYLLGIGTPSGLTSIKKKVLLNQGYEFLHVMAGELPSSWQENFIATLPPRPNKKEAASLLPQDISPSGFLTRLGRLMDNPPLLLT